MNRAFRFCWRSGLVALAAAATVLPLSVVGATTTGPEVSVDRQRIEEGERVELTIAGFDAAVVTISICGNEARMGSPDCNLYASEGIRLAATGAPTVTRIPVAAPPVPCPCVIRVASRGNDEIALVPISIVGHPTAPTTESDGLGESVEVSITARPNPAGLFESARASLGGPVNYSVTVTVKNLTVVALRQVVITGEGRRGGDGVVSLNLDDPGLLRPGQTWQQVVSARVPAPSVGGLEWSVTVSGAGPSVTAVSTSRERPTLLLLLAMILVVDVAVMAIRRRIRRRSVLADVLASPGAEISQRAVRPPPP